MPGRSRARSPIGTALANTQMASKGEIVQQDFEGLLVWLDADRQRAGEKYEKIRKRLIQIFCARGCPVPEELADETIDRVAKKANSLIAQYDGEPALYFYAVAKKVFLEFTRRPKSEELPPTISAPQGPDERTEEYQSCLDRCLQNLDEQQRELIIGYYTGDRQEKIDGRRKLQIRLGVTSETLRVRALRIRQSLQKCVIRCVQGEFS